MTITEISELVGLIATGFGLIVSIFVYVRRVFKDIKEKKLKAFIEEKIIEAEKRSDLNGSQKLVYVLSCLYEEYGKEYDKIIDNSKEYIEECIEFSKKVNNKERKE